MKRAMRACLVGTFVGATLLAASAAYAEEVPTVKVPVSLHRSLEDDPGAPQIKCDPVVTEGEGYGGPWIKVTNERHVATAVRVVPLLDYDVPVVSFGPNFKASYRVFGRDASGNEFGRLTAWDALLMLSGSQHRTELFDMPLLAEYCFALKTWPISDANAAKVTESCTPGTGFDSVVHDEEERKHVLGELRRCSNPVFPEGYSAEHPTKSRETDSCSMNRGRLASTAASPFALLMLASAAVGRRFVRRRARTAR